MRRGSVTPEEEREQSEATQAAMKEALASVAPVVAENEEEKAEYQLEEAFAEDEEARALPRESVEFLILCFGGKIGWEGEGSPFSYTDPAITHVVMDRPTIPQPLPNRDYVQPQWLFDSVNNGMLLPVERYQPGKPLPPHLSPFEDNEAEG